MRTLKLFTYIYYSIFHRFTYQRSGLHIKCGPKRTDPVAVRRTAAVTIARVNEAIVACATPKSTTDSMRTMGVSTIFCCPLIRV